MSHVYKEGRFLYHFLFWTALYALWVAVFRSYSIALTRTLSIEFCYLIFIGADYYLLHYFIVPRLLFRKRYSVFVLALAGTILLSAGLRTLVALQINRHFFHLAAGSAPAEVFTNSLFNISIWVLAITLGKMLLDRINTQQQMASLERERATTELEFLKAQVNPHSLFNSLNTIYGHIDKNNPVARDILLRFSGLLRYQLYDCAVEKISLEKEVAYLNDYISFQRLRKEDRLLLDIDMGFSGPDLQIAPLLLVVLIENAFKHVSNFPDRENKISIRINNENKMLTCHIINTKEEPQAATLQNEKGIGIANLKKRLDLLYPQKYSLANGTGPELYETRLIMDLS